MKADTLSATEGDMVAKKEGSPYKDSSFTAVGTLRAHSSKLVSRGEREIVEDPPLLQQFNSLCEAITDAFGDDLRLGEIRVTELFYITEIQGVSELYGQSGCMDAVAALLKQLHDSRMRLEANCQRDTPAAAAECGVDEKHLGVLRAASELAGAECTAEVELAGHAPAQIPAPDKKVFMALPASANHKDKKIDGEITGIGIGDARGCRVEVAKRSMYLVHGLELEDAWRLLRAHTRLLGTAKWAQDAYVVTAPKYESRLIE